MSLPRESVAPSWVESDAHQIRGLDLLGLRLPVQHVGNSLLNGVTTVTPSIRYLSFRTWVAHSYIRAKMPDQWTSFRDYAARAEAAIALGSILSDRHDGGVVGITEARKLVASDLDPLPLRSFVGQLGVSLYAGPSEQLGLSFSSKSGVPGLSRERGQPLAEMLDDLLSRSRVGRSLSGGELLKEASRDDLAEFGRLTSPAEIPADERERLVSTLFPMDPLSRGELARIASYALLLHLAERLGRRPREGDLFEASMNPSQTLPEVILPTLDGWLMYCVRDLLAVVHEATLRATVLCLRDAGRAPGMPIDANEVIRTLVSHEADHNEALREIGLVNRKETFVDLTFTKVCERVEEKVRNRLEERDGLVRWASPLNELVIDRSALISGVGAVALLPVAWIVASKRISASVGSGARAIEELSRLGWARVGLRQVVLPGLDKFRAENWQYKDVMAELARRTVDQHLRVSWSRMVSDPLRDVAVLTSDASRWSYRKDFEAGRTDSRLDRAISWLAQLSLIDDGGLTADGSVVLKNALKTLGTRVTG